MGTTTRAVQQRCAILCGRGGAVAGAEMPSSLGRRVRYYKMLYLYVVFFYRSRTPSGQNKKYLIFCFADWDLFLANAHTVLIPPSASLAQLNARADVWEVVRCAETRREDTIMTT